QKFANLRCLYAYMFTHPGGKLLFMGNEFGATTEWNYKTELPWDLLQYDPHQKLQDFVRDLNELLQNEPALYQKQFCTEGFEWIDLDHRPESIVVYRRMGKHASDDLIIILNLTPVVRLNWKIHVSGKKQWQEIFNSNDSRYWGTGDVFNPDI